MNYFKSYMGRYPGLNDISLELAVVFVMTVLVMVVFVMIALVLILVLSLFMVSLFMISLLLLGVSMVLSLLRTTWLTT